ncbi:kelch domain-containing protein 10 homolog [Phlebotomus argentipes]|uniref:kelch domain-containing protein 10 homolog n=1 Tax=Phlebotomus argentipes TaxID=94469 RepID=UPI0028936077|nr:kelch domain-containing protein 10 homolog [Phlebotomus argentipes]
MAAEVKIDCFAQKPFRLVKLSIVSPNMLVRTSSQNGDPKFECRGWKLFFTNEFECRNMTQTHIYNVFTSTWSTMEAVDDSLQEPNRHVFKTRYGKRIAYEYEDGEELPEIPRPEQPLECYGSTVYGDYLYTFGDLSISEEGGDRKFLCEIFRVHLKGMGHEYISRPVHQNSDRRFDYSVVVVQERVFFIGGQGFDQLVDLVELPVFSLESLAWTTVNTKPDRRGKSIQNYPEARVTPSCLVIDTPTGQEIVVAGGNGKFDNCTDIWALNLTTYEWRFINVIEQINLMIMRVAQSHPNCMYICGTTGHFEIYRMWLQIPRLETMCLEAISHYGLYKIPDADLLRFRVPPRFFEDLKK